MDELFKKRVQQYVEEHIYVIHHGAQLQVAFNWHGHEIDLADERVAGSYDARRSMLVAALTDLVIDAYELHNCKEHVINEVIEI